MFADRRNDLVFRRAFAGHPDILHGLLNDLLERRREAINHISANERRYSEGHTQ